MTHFVPGAVGDTDRRSEAQKLREERELAAKTIPVVITGIRIPFWPLVWWIVGVTAGVSLVHTALDWLLALFLTPPA